MPLRFGGQSVSRLLNPRQPSELERNRRLAEARARENEIIELLHQQQQFLEQLQFERDRQTYKYELARKRVIPKKPRRTI
jgi:hypothetical protein